MDNETLINSLHTNTVMLKDGTTFSIQWYGEGTDGTIGIQFLTNTMIEIATAFSDKDNISVLTFTKPNGANDPITEILTGDREVRDIIVQPNSTVYLALKSV